VKKNLEFSYFGPIMMSCLVDFQQNLEWFKWFYS